MQLASIGVANVEANRRELREMLFTSPDIEKYISGVVSLVMIMITLDFLQLANLFAFQNVTYFIYFYL